MKFITEMELRELYKKEAFTSFILQPDAKITPGARQFLVDRRVTLVQDPCTKEKTASTNPVQQTQQQENWVNLRMRRRMEYIESLFLLFAAELLQGGNVVLSEEVMALGKSFQNVRRAEQEQLAPEALQFWGWTEEEIKKRSENLEKHVDLSEFHVGMDNGKEIALLNHLRAALGEVEPALLEVYWDEGKQECARQDLIDTVNRIINILCMMMWKCLGGKKWKL